MNKRIKFYIEKEPVLWNASISGSDRYYDELGYFQSKEKAIQLVKKELILCDDSSYVYGAHAYVRGFNYKRALKEIKEKQDSINSIQEEIDTITRIIEG